jgi:hypothetical protein
LCPPLEKAAQIDITRCSIPQVISLFDYARPDAVITVDDRPVVSIEQTQMNPSGHNIPQRFSCLVRAAELGVPSILYYPEYSRRTYSDPNKRNLQIRVPLGQFRLMRLYHVASLSVFWPTDPQTLLPITCQSAHQQMADVVGAIVTGKGTNTTNLVEVQSAIKNMRSVIDKYASDYKKNPSVRRLLPNGFLSSITNNGVSIDPPTKAQLLTTDKFLNSLKEYQADPDWPTISSKLAMRPHTLLFTGTANKTKNDSEHPWPGYLTLLDVLYLRQDHGRSTTQRNANLVYKLPVDLSTFVARVNQRKPPTATYIADSFSDVIILNGGVIAGRPLRGTSKARPVLTI